MTTKGVVIIKGYVSMKKTKKHFKTKDRDMCKQATCFITTLQASMFLDLSTTSSSEKRNKHNTDVLKVTDFWGPLLGSSYLSLTWDQKF